MTGFESDPSSSSGRGRNPGCPGASCVYADGSRCHAWSRISRCGQLLLAVTRIGVETLFIEPGSPWENGYIESFNGKLRDQFLDGEIFYTLQEAKVLLERRRWHYNHIRPHSSLGNRPPAPEATLPRGAVLASLGLPPWGAAEPSLAGAK